MQMAFKYLSYVMYPLLVAYAVYSLLYDEHKSWYSFVVGMAAGAVYTFGMSGGDRNAMVCLRGLRSGLD